MYDNAEIIETTETHRVLLVPDTDTQNPRRDWDHVGVLMAKHRRYDLGDHTDAAEEVSRFSDWMQEVSDQPLIESLVKHIVRTYGSKAILPVYLLDHSGLSVSCGENLVRADDLNIQARTGWDSGLLGFIFDTLDNGWDTTEQAVEGLRSEITELDQYLTDDVYGYVIEEKVRKHHTVTDLSTGVVREYDTEDWDQVDALWGLYGREYAEGEAKAELAMFASQETAQG